MAMTSDSGGAMFAAELEEFLTTGALFAKIATTLPDGWPVVRPAWYEWETDARPFQIANQVRTSILQNLRCDPCCGLLVDNTAVPLQPGERAGGGGRLPPRTSTGVAPAQRYQGPERFYAEARLDSPGSSLFACLCTGCRHGTAPGSTAPSPPTACGTEPLDLRPKMINYSPLGGGAFPAAL